MTDVVAPLEGAVIPFNAHDTEDELPECPKCGRVFVVTEGVVAVEPGKPLPCCEDKP